MSQSVLGSKPETGYGRFLVVSSVSPDIFGRMPKIVGDSDLP
jgi:hypothetical protein